MTGKFTAVPGLNGLVARMIVPAVNKVVDEVADIARRNAPPTKMWETEGDALVRDEHRHASGQEVPSNLRFTIEAMLWDQQHKGLGPFIWVHEPPDDPLYDVENFISLRNCRCRPLFSPDGIRKLIRTQPATARGTTVRGSVIAEGNHVIGAEYGDVYPNGATAAGTYFMTATVAQARTMMRNPR